MFTEHSHQSIKDNLSLERERERREREEREKCVYAFMNVKNTVNVFFV